MPTLRIVRRGSALALLWLATSAVLSAQRGGESPEAVIRSLVLAMYSNDVAAYNRITLPHPLRSRLTTGGRANESGLQELRRDPASLQINQKRGFEFQGKPASPGKDGQYPEGTTALYRIAHRGSPMNVELVRKTDGWKVDVRWWVAMTELMSGPEPRRDSPEFAIKSLLMNVLQFDRRAAAGFLVDPRQVELLFDGAPRQRDPSGVLEASAMEMPLVELGPGEFSPTLLGAIVEGGTAADRKVMVGWFGSIELVFTLHKAGGTWKIEALPYYALMNQ